MSNSSFRGAQLPPAALPPPPAAVGPGSSDGDSSSGESGSSGGGGGGGVGGRQSGGKRRGEEPGEGRRRRGEKKKRSKRRKKRKREEKEENDGRIRRKRTDAEKIAEKEALVAELARRPAGWGAAGRPGLGKGALAASGASGPGAASGHFFDSRPDPSNAAFGGLYRVDVARFVRGAPGLLLGGQFAGPRAQRSTGGWAAADPFEGRFFAPAAVGRERSRKTRRLRLPRLPRPAAVVASAAEAFVPLDDRAGQRQGGGTMWERQGEDEEVGETVEGTLLQRTRALNEAVRREPGHPARWLALVRFQDEALLAAAGAVRPSEAAAKKAAVLERGIREVRFIE